MSSTTTNMNLVLPTPGKNGTTGPDWATQLDAALTKVDSHDHTSTNGVKIPSAALNINADLSFGSFALGSLKSAGLVNNTSSITTTTTVYAKNGELYFVDAAGNQVKLTSGGSINVASLGTIGGDFSTSTATVTYNATSKGFTFKQDSNSTADIAAGSYFMYENAASANYVKLKSPASLASSYDLTFFTALPASTLPVSLSSTGALSTGQITTAQITDASITTAKIVDANVTTAKINDAAVTQGKRATLPYAQSSTCTVSTSSTSFVDATGLTVTVTTTGRPVWIGLIGMDASDALIGASGSHGRDGYSYFSIVRGSTEISRARVATYFQNVSSTGNTVEVSIPPGALQTIDFGASAGSTTYKIQYKGDVSTSAVIQNARLVAYEL